jgi:hypothetical protein
VTVRISDVTEGTILFTDGGFTCIEEGVRRVVHRDEDGSLWIACRQGRHYLNGQVEKNMYVGLTRTRGVF